MKTKNNIQFFLIASVVTVLFLFTSCSDNGDTTPPAINLTSPAQGAVIKVGSELCFEMEVSDNEALKSYKIEIHNNIENPHDHSRATATEGTVKYFKYENTWTDIEGLRNKLVHHHEIRIPEDVILGNYHLVVYCTDMAGNESHVARNIVISDEGEEPHHHD